MGILPPLLDITQYPAGATFSPQVATDIASFQAALIARLQSKIQGSSPNLIEVTDFPDKPEEWRLTHPVGSILVGFRGTRYEKPAPTDITVQDCERHFEIAVVLRDLGWLKGSGAYAFLTQIGQALMGYRVPGARRKTYLVETQFVSRKDGVWVFTLMVAVPSVEIQVSEDYVFPTLHKVTIHDTSGATSPADSFQAIDSGGKAPTNPSN